MTLEEYTALDAVALAGLVRGGSATAAELADLALAAAALIEPRIHSIVELFDPAEAIVEAAPFGDGPFAGVPMLVKDLGATLAGRRHEQASRLLRGHVAVADSALAGRYRAAGFSLLGRTNTPEFGLNPSTEPVLNGPTRNPWDLSRSAGGSSGGASAAVAAGIVPVAHGTDGGGSIRCPSSACGLFGLKPSRGRNPSGPAIDEAAFGIVGEHVLTRSVRDSAAILDATAGASVGARLAVPRPERPFASAATEDPRPLRIGWTASPPPRGPAIDAECLTATRAATALCSELGHELVEVALPVSFEEIVAVYADLHAFAFAAEMPALESAGGRRADETTMEWASVLALAHGRGMDVDAFGRMQSLHNSIARRMGALFETIDVMLSPVLSGPSVPLGFMNADDRSLNYLEMTARFFTIMPFTPLFNLTGQPAMSVPLHWSAAGLPVGVQFAGRLGAEATLFALAGQLERARPWHGRRPPVHAGRIRGR